MQLGSGVSRHKCLVYDGDPAEQLPVVVPLLVEGLRDNWRCLYLGSPDAVRMVGTALDARGVEVERECDRGALSLSSDRGHLVGGRFDPIAMVDGLCTGIDDAVRAGFAGLCATGDMRWELGEDHNFDRLLEYEARLERVFRDKPLRGICQYHRDILPPRAIRDALVTHSAAYIGGALNSENLFYIPPELLLDGDAVRHGEWMCQQIVRVLDAERARDRALAELADLNRALEQRVVERTEELAVANRHLEAFSYSVAHDLRAPLRAIRAFAGMLEELGPVLDTANRDHLRRVVGATEQMGDRIDALLELSRISRVELARVPVDLGRVAASAVDELRARDPARAVDVAIAPDLHADADARLVRALVDNLLANAWKFTATRARARIDIGVHRDGAVPVFFVRDDGVGFDPTYADRLFAPFQRLHGREFPGTGVGLATVQRIVERHRGRIWAESVVDEGATFFFTLADAS